MVRILVIDDDASLLQMVRLMLEREGHQVTLAEGGEVGLAAAFAQNPDLAVIDLMMPGMSGYTVTRALRADKRTQKLPILILTARGQPTDRQMAMDAGANAHLTKPITSRELLARIHDALSGKVELRTPISPVASEAAQEVAPSTPGESVMPPAASVQPPAPIITPPPASTPGVTVELPPLPGDPPGPPAPIVTLPAPTQTAHRPKRRPIGATGQLPALVPPGTPAPVPVTQLGQVPTLPIVSVIGLRGGSGATTLAINLAILLNERKGRVCLVDLTMSGGHIGLQLRMVARQTWGDLLQYGDAPDPRIVGTIPVPHPLLGLSVVAAPQVPTVETLSHKSASSVLSVLAGSFGTLVVDIDSLTPASVAALQSSYAVVVVTGDDVMAVHTASNLMQTLQKLGIETGRVRVAINHSRSDAGVPSATIVKALGRPISGEIPYEVNQANAMRKGVPLVSSAPDSPFSQALQQLLKTF